MFREEIDNDDPIRITWVGGYDAQPVTNNHEEGAAEVLLSLCLGKYNDEYLQ